jgi:hypothetical protein
LSEALGRDYYENGAEPGRGYRDGYRRGRLRTAEGPIEYGVPQVADRAEPISRVRAGLAGRTAELEHRLDMNRVGVHEHKEVFWHGHSRRSQSGRVSRPWLASILGT